MDEIPESYSRIFVGAKPPLYVSPFCNALMYTYPTVLLSLPLGGVLVNVSTSSTVRKLEEAGKHEVDVCCVRKNGILKVHPMWNDVVVLVHPKNRSRCDRANSSVASKVYKLTGLTCADKHMSIVNGSNGKKAKWCICTLKHESLNPANFKPEAQLCMFPIFSNNVKRVREEVLKQHISIHLEFI